MFNLKAGNGQIILTSEIYSEKRSAEAGIASVKKNALVDARFERKVGKDGSPYFVLTATNGQTIGRSEMYKSTTSRENGVKSVKNHAPGAVIDDQSV